MPRQYDLTWVKSRSLWRKVYRELVYTISVRQLTKLFGLVPDNKEGSYPFARRWWKDRQAEIDATSVEQPIPRQVRIVLAMLGVPREEWSKRLPMYLHEANSGFLREMESLFVENHIQDGIPLKPEQRELLGYDIATPIEAAQQAYLGDASPAPLELQIGTLAEQWLTKMKAKLGADAFANCKRKIGELLEQINPSADVGSLKWANVLDSFHTFCEQKKKEREEDPEVGWSGYYARDTFHEVRKFICWLSESERIDPPRNLASRFSFNIVTEEPNPWTLQEAKVGLQLADDTLRLYFLLALNCGYGSKDIADLSPTEVDLVTGTIDRYRSKMMRRNSRMKLAFTLWPTTASLLREHAVDTGDRLLLTENGTPLRGVGRKDYIARRFERFRERQLLTVLPGFDKSFYDLRKCGATLIGNQFEEKYSIGYLNQKPRQVAGKHYVPVSPEQLAEAVRWLGEQLGQC